MKVYSSAAAIPFVGWALGAAAAAAVVAGGIPPREEISRSVDYSTVDFLGSFLPLKMKLHRAELKIDAPFTARNFTDLCNCQITHKRSLLPELDRSIW